MAPRKPLPPWAQARQLMIEAEHCYRSAKKDNAHAEAHIYRQIADEARMESLRLAKAYTIAIDPLSDPPSLTRSKPKN